VPISGPETTAAETTSISTAEIDVVSAAAFGSANDIIKIFYLIGNYTFFIYHLKKNSGLPSS